VSRAIALLTGIHWIREIRLKDNGRAYKIGFESTPDTRGHKQCVYVADLWIEKAFNQLPKHLRGWQHTAISQRTSALVVALQRVVDGEEDLWRP
jgi:hypothetical protein